jgi:hypothetical protein
VSDDVQPTAGEDGGDFAAGELIAFHDWLGQACAVIQTLALIVIAVALVSIAA